MKNFKQDCKTLIRPIYIWLKSNIVYLRACVFGNKITDYTIIPIIINNFNRLECLQKLISRLETYGYKNIYIIDNASTFPPLLEYYEKCPYQVFRLTENVGYLALWKTKIYKQFIRGYYVYTDPDVLMLDECPKNFLQKFYEILQKYPKCPKVGFSLKIDDLPDYFKNKQKVIAWESQFWNSKCEEGIFNAPIDTTFALYRPFAKGGASQDAYHLRTDFPYQARHLPWYVDSKNLSDEDVFYINSITTLTHWTEIQSDKNNSPEI
ncbi:MAG: glycosyltransferase family 2 protein [Bacteroidales bacterium]